MTTLNSSSCRSKCSCFCSNNPFLIVTEAYVQGGTEIQVVYPTDLYLPTISLQFQQSVYKYLHQNFLLLTKRIRTYFLVNGIYCANTTVHI